ARTLALIGSGWQAGAQLMAALAARKFGEVRVYSPRKESRDAYVAEAQSRHAGVDIRAVDSAQAAAAGADVIAAATSSMVRVIDPAWLQTGVHASCIKSQEVDREVFARCDRVALHTSEQP